MSKSTSSEPVFSETTNIEDVKPNVSATAYETDEMCLPKLLVNEAGIVLGWANQLQLKHFLLIQSTGRLSIDPASPSSIIMTTALKATPCWLANRVRTKSSADGGKVDATEKAAHAKNTNGTLFVGSDFEGRKVTTKLIENWKIARAQLQQTIQDLAGRNEDENHVSEVLSYLLEMGTTSNHVRFREISIKMYPSSFVGHEMYSNGTALIHAVLVNGRSTGLPVYYSTEPRPYTTSKASTAADTVCGKRKRSPPGIIQHWPTGLHGDAWAAFARSLEAWNNNTPLQSERGVPCRQFLTHTAMRFLVKMSGGSFRVRWAPNDIEANRGKKTTEEAHKYQPRFFCIPMAHGDGLLGLPEAMVQFKGNDQYPKYAKEYVLDGVMGNLRHARGPEPMGRAILDILDALDECVLTFGKSTLKEFQAVLAKSVAECAMPENYTTIVFEVTGKKGGNYQGFMKDLMRMC